MALYLKAGDDNQANIARSENDCIIGSAARLPPRRAQMRLLRAEAHRGELINLHPKLDDARRCKGHGLIYERFRLP
jgi:hypothetical protein